MMRKTKHSNIESKLTVDIDELTAMLSCGKATAKRIGTDAGAKIKIGRRVLYSVSKVEDYIENIVSEQ